MAMGRWGQEMWLSDRDFLNGMIAAISAKGIQFAALNLMSDNLGMRWDITETKRVIGYDPKDGSLARVTFLLAIKSWIKKAVKSVTSSIKFLVLKIILKEWSIFLTRPKHTIATQHHVVDFFKEIKFHSHNTTSL